MSGNPSKGKYFEVLGGYLVAVARKRKSEETFSSALVLWGSYSYCLLASRGVDTHVVGSARDADSTIGYASRGRRCYQDSREADLYRS